MSDQRVIEICDDLNQLSRSVIGAAIEVHRHLGPGFLESVYEEAFAIELGLRSISFQRQLQHVIQYKSASVGMHQLDFLIEQRMVVELKTVEIVADLHKAQILSYLKSTKLKLGLLLNFKVPLLRDGIHRIILTNAVTH